MNPWFRKIKARTPAIILLAATLLFWGFYDRYEVAGPILTESPSLADATRVRGDCAETEHGFVVTVSDEGKMAGVNFRLDGAMEYDLIRVRGRMRGEGVVEGKFPWRCARLLLIQYDKNNKWVPGDHGVISESGTFDWLFEEDVFERLPSAVHADLVIENRGDSGVVWFDQLVAEPVRVRASFVWLRIVFATAWVVLAALFYKRCRLDHRKLRILILLNTFAILAGALVPSAWIAEPAEELKDWFEQRVKNEVPAPSKIDATTSPEKPEKSAAEKQKALAAANAKRIDRFNETVGGAHQAGHFVLFATLCFLVYCSAALEGQGPAYYFKVGGDLLLFAAITESLQHLTLDRTAGFSDFLTDTYGMALAFVVFLAARLIPVFRKRVKTL